MLLWIAAWFMGAGTIPPPTDEYGFYPGLAGVAVLAGSWVANLAWPVGLVALLFASSGRWAIRIGAIGFVTGSLVVVALAIIVPTEWAPSLPDSLPRYALWVAALATPLIAVAVERRRRALGSEQPLTDSGDARTAAAGVGARLASGYWTWAALSVLLYVVACVLPALEIERGFDEIYQPMVGFSSLVNGVWIIDDGSLLTFSWLGNLGWPIGLLASVLARGGGWAMGIGAVGLATCSFTAIHFLAGLDISPGYPYSIVALGPGYFLWTAALSMPLIAAIVERRRSARSSGGE